MLLAFTPTRLAGGGRVGPARAAGARPSPSRPHRGAALVTPRATPDKATAPAAEHFEPADVKVGECLLEDAR